MTTQIDANACGLLDTIRSVLRMDLLNVALSAKYYVTDCFEIDSLPRISVDVQHCSSISSAHLDSFPPTYIQLPIELFSMNIHVDVV